jgi:Fe2+ transport system protein FeoA
MFYKIKGHITIEVKELDPTLKSLAFDIKRMFLDQGLVPDADIELVEGKVFSWVLQVYFKKSSPISLSVHGLDSL